MKITATHHYSLKMNTGSVFNFPKETYFPVMLHLLVLTRMNRWVCEKSFKEFLTRLFLILDRPMQNSVDIFLENNLLLQGKIADRSFEFSLEDLLDFTGYSRGNLKFHCWGTLQEFIKEYQAVNYEVRAEESMEGEEFSLSKVSDDWLLMTIAMNYGLYDLAHLSLNFKPDLLQLEESELDEAVRFADFLIGRIPKDFFPNYEEEKKKRLKAYSYAFTQQDTLILDVEKLLPSNRILKIMQIILGSDHSDYQTYVRALKEEIGFPESLEDYLSLIKMGIGVKYGLIQLSDSTEDFHDCFDPRFENGALAKNLYQPGLTTSMLFRKNTMINWLHLLP